MKFKQKVFYYFFLIHKIYKAAKVKSPESTLNTTYLGQGQEILINGNLLRMELPQLSSLGTLTQGPSKQL